MSWPELPADTEADITIEGRVRRVCGRRLILLPYAAPRGPGRGRRYRIELDAWSAFTRVVFGVAGQAALCPPGSVALADDQPVRIRLHARQARRTRRVPDDLRQALAAAGATLDGLDPATAQHLVLTVTEARDPVIRADRIHAALAAVSASAPDLLTRP